MRPSKGDMLREEMGRLDVMARRLAPCTRREMIISGDRTVVDDADETDFWSDLGDLDARERGGEGGTKAVHRSTDRVQKSIDALIAAAEELGRAGGRTSADARNDVAPGSCDEARVSGPES